MIVDDFVMVIGFNDLGVLLKHHSFCAIWRFVIGIGHGFLQRIAWRELLTGSAPLRPVDKGEFVHGFWFRGF